MKIIALKDAIINNERIIITSHVFPDGDSCGTCAALFNIIRLCRLGVFGYCINKQAVVVMEHAIPSYLKFIMEGVCVTSINNLDREGVFSANNYVVLCVDTIPTEERIGAGVYELVKSAKDVYTLDHHDTDYTINYFCDSTAASCSVLALRLYYKLLQNFKKQGVNKTINERILRAVALGLITDTKYFQTAETNAEAFTVAASLLRLGISFDELREKTQCKSLLDVRRERMLWDRCHFYYSSINKGNYVMLSTVNSDIYGSVRPGRAISELSKLCLCDIAVSSLCIVDENDTDYGRHIVNIRSNNAIDVCSFIREYNGGGHKQACGASFENSYLWLIFLKEFLKKFTKGCIKHLKFL